MRRLSAILLGLGFAAVVIALPLWNVTRSDTSGCVVHHSFPCDPREVLPYGTLAAGLTYFGIVALSVVLVIVLVSGFVTLMKRVRAIEAQERAARHTAR